MAEYVLGYILLLERKILVAKSLQDEKVLLDPTVCLFCTSMLFTQATGMCTQAWLEAPFKEETRPLAGLTLGLLGCGDIGVQIAKAAKVMGLKTAAFKRDTSLPGENTSVVSLVLRYVKWPLRCTRAPI